MNTVCDINTCTGCMLCIEVCPHNAISMDETLFAQNAQINLDLCANCNLCKKLCPQMDSYMKNEPIKLCQGWAEGVARQNASSGGAAYAISSAFIQQGGYVAACDFNDGDFSFVVTNRLVEINRFQGSKYVKSNPIGIYEKVKTIINNNKLLFIGLPCQVAAIKKYIGNNDNLYTIDLICHGAPTKKNLAKYLAEHNITIDKVKDIRFRRKTKYTIEIDGEIVDKENYIDDYMLAFLNSLNCSESCINCEYASYQRVGDVTLGDSWGTELDISKGVSLIILSTEKGKCLVDAANMELYSVDEQIAVKNNEPLRSPVRAKRSRVRFCRMINKGCSYKKALFLSSWTIYLKRSVKKVLRVG